MIALRLVVLLLLALVTLPTSAVAADPVPVDPDLALGLRQVAEGDFESAIPTLHAVAQRMEGDPVRSGDRARALLHLGVAQVALERHDDARLSFQAALAADSRIQPTTLEFSPKVVRAFEAARAEMKARAPQPSPRPSRTKAWALGGAGAAAAGAAVLLGGGGDEAEGAVSFANARFGTPVIVCPDGSHNLPLAFTILVDADTSAAATILSVTTTAIIVTSAQPSEVGFASAQAARATPSRLPEGRTTVAVDTTLTCGNGTGDAPRFNEWTGRVTLTTSSGTTTLSTVDLMRVNVP